MVQPNTDNTNDFQMKQTQLKYRLEYASHTGKFITKSSNSNVKCPV